jgi:Alternative complex III, ActD subunit
MRAKTLGLYGVMAEFGGPRRLLAAIDRCREAGYTRMDAFTPYPIEEVSHALGHTRSKLPLLVLIGGIVGALGGFGLQYWTAVVGYAHNVGGRPLNSWVAFIPVTFETTVLVASLAAVLGMLALNGLPMPYHPVFNAKRFALASRDRYFLCIEARDPHFDHAATAELLRGLEATEVSDVEN